jgi:hypothetical protein
MTRVGPLVPARVALNNVLRDGHTLLGFLPLQRFRNRAATDAGFASPGSGCVFGLSQPPDALFRPGPRRSCFVPAALMGFPLQRFVPSRCRERLSASPAPPGVVVDDGPWPSSKSGPVPQRRGGRVPSPRSGSVRHARMGSFPGAPSGVCARPGSPYSGQRGLAACRSRSSPGFSSLQGVPPLCLRATDAARSSHALQRRRAETGRHLCRRVSIGRKMGLSLSRLPTLLVFSSSSRDWRVRPWLASGFGLITPGVGHDVGNL